jgi:outer membrane protein TolC
MRLRRYIPVLCGAGLCFALCLGAQAQLSLSSAVDLALKNSFKVKMAQADVDKARAALEETRDTFIPSVGISGGVGKSSGPPLAVPQVFTLSAQSLVFNFSIRDYIRAANAALAAAQLSLEEARVGVTEDVVSTYLALDNAVQRRAAAEQARSVADRLSEIVQGRFEAGVDPHVEVSRARRTGLQMQRQELNSEDDIANLSDHLSTLVGVRLTGSEIAHTSIPASFPRDSEGPPPDSPALKAAQATAVNRMYTARAQERYLFRPQFTFGATYSYISTAFTNYDVYYQRFTVAAQDNPNSLSMGVQVSVPLLDFTHRAHARGAAAEAARSHYEVEDARNSFREGNGKSLRARRQLSLTAELAKADRDLAQDELDTILVQLQAGSSGPGPGGGVPLSPKDEQNARLQVQQRTLDMLNADLQLQQSEVTLMRQEGTLTDWVRSSLPAAPAPALTAVPLSPRP